MGPGCYAHPVTSLSSFRLSTWKVLGGWLGAGLMSSALFVVVFGS